MPVAIVLGMSGLCFGVVEDLRGFWSDKPFLTNVVSNLSGALIGIPVGIIVLQRIVAQQAHVSEQLRVRRRLRAALEEIEALIFDGFFRDWAQVRTTIYESLNSARRELELLLEMYEQLVSRSGVDQYDVELRSLHGWGQLQRQALLYSERRSALNDHIVESLVKSSETRKIVRVDRRRVIMPGWELDLKYAWGRLLELHSLYTQAGLEWMDETVEQIMERHFADSDSSVARLPSSYSIADTTTGNEQPEKEWVHLLLDGNKTVEQLQVIRDRIGRLLGVHTIDLEIPLLDILVVDFQQVVLNLFPPRSSSSETPLEERRIMREAWFRDSDFY
ncbi:hypothetical protein [Actinomycetospora sp. TBRC 11914]|uniref:hypothetical protein n=1 Tax=Actinomycetospora sp. TBRC 11914 TaxID=2729387 RepID=UPI00145F1BB5|nr:hypothetical protein [Actinomycetospora sp. TBRC 11914]NMO90605.1 hypothetical protein [Actinomycetospora sp. TBRC 11914]